MALSVVQRGDTGATPIASGSAGQILPGNSTSGNMILVAFAVPYFALNSVVSVSSSIGTFTRINSQIPWSPTDMEWWVCLSATGPADTVTVTTTASVSWEAFGIEISGAASAANGGYNSGTSANPNLVFSGLVPGQMVLAELLNNYTITAGPTSPWSDYNAGGYFNWADGDDTAWQIVSAASTTAIWTVASSAATWGVLGVIVTPTAVAPTVGSELAYSYGPTIDVLVATVTPSSLSTTVSFSYGPTNSYGNTSSSVTVSGWSPVTVYIPVTGLTLGNTYHYQVSATNSAGTTNGTDATFTAIGMPDVASGQGMGALGGAGMSGQPALPVLSNTTSQNYGPSIEVLSVTLTTGDEGNVVYFKYGPVTGSWGGSNWGAGPLYTLTSPSVTTVAGQTVVNIPVAGLVQGESYQFQAVVT